MEKQIAKGVRMPVYRLRSKSFSKMYSLGILSYIPDSRSLKQSEEHLFKLIVDESIYPEGSGMFSITDVHNHCILIPAHCMQIIELARFYIMDSIEGFKTKVEMGYLPEPHHYFFDFVHPVADDKHLFIRGQFLEIVDEIVKMKFIMSYAGVGHENIPDSVLNFMDPPTVVFQGENFLHFLHSFFPCVGLYTSGLAIHNYDICAAYMSDRRKIDKTLYYDVLSHDTSYYEKFIEDNSVVLLYT